MTLALRGWVGPAGRRLSVTVAAGTCAEAVVPDARALIARIAGLAAPGVWVRVGDVELGRAGPAARARAGLATVDGRIPASPELTVLDVVQAGRPLPGALGFLGPFTQARRGLAAEREAEARALAGSLGLGPLLDERVAGLDRRTAALVDLARALLAEPRAVVAALPDDEEAAARLRAGLAAEAGRRGLGVLLLRHGHPGIGSPAQ